MSSTISKGTELSTQFSDVFGKKSIIAGTYRSRETLREMYGLQDVIYNLDDDPFSDTIREAIDRHTNRKGKSVDKNIGKNAHFSGPRPPAGSREEHKWLKQRVEETRHLYNPIRTKGNAEDDI
ncbi:hypothetical protein E8E14_013248 [Neopestalotiopsis sp. 37M]|nr:hypothetical protein E8E14_013248 [Neopestalotiopsis sp. 37M]